MDFQNPGNLNVLDPVVISNGNKYVKDCWREKLEHVLWTNVTRFFNFWYGLKTFENYDCADQKARLSYLTIDKFRTIT